MLTIPLAAKFDLLSHYREVAQRTRVTCRRLCALAKEIQVTQRFILAFLLIERSVRVTRAASVPTPCRCRHDYRLGQAA